MRIHNMYIGKEVALYWVQYVIVDSIKPWSRQASLGFFIGYDQLYMFVLDHQKHIKSVASAISPYTVSNLCNADRSQQRTLVSRKSVGDEKCVD